MSRRSQSFEKPVGKLVSWSLSGSWPVPVRVPIKVELLNDQRHIWGWGFVWVRKERSCLWK